jgi:hypothetical protein
VVLNGAICGEGLAWHRAGTYKRLDVATGELAERPGAPVLGWAAVTTVSAALPRPAALLRLVAGRGMFRISAQLMAIALVGVWGGHTFAVFANAVGLFMWLPQTIAAPEKAALKVLPRTRLLTPVLARMVLVLAAAPVLALLAVLVAVTVVAPTSVAAVYLAAATWGCGNGLLMTVSGLHRLRGRPSLDAAAFGASAAVLVIATGTTWLVGWAPQLHLLSLVLGNVLVTTAAIAALPSDWLRPGPGPQHRLFPKLIRTTALLGISDVVDVLSTSVVFLALAASGQIVDSGPLYLALLASAAVCQLIFFLLRVAQPATSARLRGTGGAAGRVRALGLLRRAERCGIGFAVVFAVAALVPGTRGWLLGDGGSLPVVLGVLVCVELVLYVAMMYAGYLLENTNSAILVVTSSAALIGLLATGVFAAVLVPALGAVGGIAVLVLTYTVRAHVSRRMLLRARPELRTAARPVADPVGR